MPMSHYPNGFAHGVSIRGVPVLQNTHGGNTFWVNSNTGADTGGNNGTREKPFATLDYAVGRCTANNGDIIVLAENHAETLAADSAVDIDVAGVTVVGLGKGSNRPTFTFATSTAADFKIAAADVSVSNCLFLCNIASQAMMIEVSGDDAEIAGCEFREGSASMLTAITVGVADGDADRCHIHDCVFRMDEPGATNVGDAAISIATDVDNVVIENNHIYGDFDLAGIDVPAGGNASDMLVIRGNYVENTATGQHAIQINTLGTMVGGSITDNRLVGDTITAILEPHTLQCLGNRASLGNTGAGDFEIPTAGVGGALQWQVAVKTLADASSTHTTGASPVTEFTVTGIVAVAGVWWDIDTAFTSTLNNGTLETGVTGSTALFCVQDAADGTAFAQHDVYSTAADNPGASSNIDEIAVVNGSGTNIITTVATNSMTAGAATIYCLWAPLSAGASVVPAGT